jgi:peptide/nickel transport system permease protein
VKDTFLYAASQFISNMYILNSLITRNWVILQDAVRHLILPSMALSTIPLAIIARMTRSSMLEVLKQDYIRTARAKGLLEKSVVLKHALRNAMLPIVTIIGLQVGALFAGAVLTETIFGLAGVGRMLFEGITARDFPIIQGFTIVIAVSYVFINLLIDLSYVFIDPRIRLN